MMHLFMRSKKPSSDPPTPASAGAAAPPSLFAATQPSRLEEENEQEDPYVSTRRSSSPSSSNTGAIVRAAVVSAAAAVASSQSATAQSQPLSAVDAGREYKYDYDYGYYDESTAVATGDVLLWSKPAVTHAQPGSDDEDGSKPHRVYHSEFSTPVADVENDGGEGKVFPWDSTSWRADTHLASAKPTTRVAAATTATTTTATTSTASTTTTSRGIPSQDAWPDVATTLPPPSPFSPSSAPPPVAARKSFRLRGAVQAVQAGLELQRLGAAQTSRSALYQLRKLWNFNDEVDEALFLERLRNTDNFNVAQFIRDLLYHVLSAGGGILAYPLCRLLESDAAARNRGFFPSKDRSIPFAVTQNFFGLFVIAMHLLYFLDLRNRVSSLAAVYTLQLMMIDVMLFLRSAVIASKYANLSPLELHLFRTTNANDRHSSLLLIPAWKKINEDSLKFETLLAAVRHEVELSQMKLVGRNAEGVMLERTALDLVNETIAEADDKVEWMRAHNIACTVILSTIHFAVPGIVRSVLGNSITQFSAQWDGAAIAWLVCFFFANVFFFGTNLQFTLIGSIDYNRRKHMLAIWGHSAEPFPLKPKFCLDITIASNITGWMICRRVIKDHGKAYLGRVQTNTMIYIVFIVAILVYLFVPLLFSRVLSVATVAVILYDVILFVVLLTMMAIPGGKCNDQQGVDVMVMQQHLISARDMIAACDAQLAIGQCPRAIKKKTDLTRAAKLFSAVASHLEMEDKFDPMQLMGLRAGTAVTNTILSLLASVLAAAFSLMSAYTVTIE